MIVPLRRLLPALLLALPLSCLANDLMRGQQLYRQHCAGCHGADGRPVWPNAPDFRRGDKLMQPDAALMQSLRGGRGAMPAFAGVMSERDLRDVIVFLRSLR